MPEGDSVLHAANVLHDHLVGEVLVRGDLYWPTAPPLGVGGKTVLEVDAYAKHILVRFNDKTSIRTHMKMDGFWRFKRTAEANSSQGSPQLRLALGTEKWTALGFMLGLLDYLPTSQEARLLEHMGPDLLSDSSVPTPFLTRTQQEPQVRLAPRRASGKLGNTRMDRQLSLQKEPAGTSARQTIDGRSISDAGWRSAISNFSTQPQSRPIAESLLDQSIVSGIGTIHMAEALFALETSPWRPIGECDIPRILVSARLNLVRATLDYPMGRTIHVHERQGKSCPRCNAIIIVEKVGQPLRLRPAFFCPRCQAR